MAVHQSDARYLDLPSSVALSPMWPRIALGDSFIHCVLVRVGDLCRLADALDPSVCKPHRTLAEAKNLLEVVRNDDHRHAHVLEIVEERVALLLEAQVADRKNLIDQE